MADFAQAVKWMKEGKKVRRDKQFMIISIIDNRFISGERIYSAEYEDIEATDWEIYKEKKTLGDEIINHHQLLCCDQASITRAVKKLKEKLRDHPGCYPTELAYKIINEVFGKEFL